MKYERVIPRDFFNEAKLLKCMGQLSLKILDNALPEGVDIKISEDGSPFRIELDGDWAILFVRNYMVTINQKIVHIGTTYNSKNIFPLLLIEDHCEYEVFDEEGSFTKEFKEICKTIK